MVEAVVSSYHNQENGLHRRAELLRWVLVQIPLGQWQRQLEGAYFMKEAQLLRGVRLHERYA